MDGIIYYIYHVESGKGYVGKHNHPNVLGRLGDHLKRKSYIGNALRKYGLPSFKVVRLDGGSSDEELNEKEQFWIEELDTLGFNGYNLHRGGAGGTGWKHSDETKKALSFAFTGHVRSEESKRKQSESLKGRKFSDSHRENLSKAGAGRVYPPEFGQKISKALTGRICSRVLTVEQVQDIRNSPEKGTWDWSTELGMAYHTIANVRAFRTFKNEGVIKCLQNTTP